MSDIITTTGRRMTVRLQEAIDNLTGADRERVIKVLSDPDPDSVVGAIHRAVALELRLAQLREQDALLGMAVDLAAPVPEDPPFPQHEPVHLWMDDAGNVIDPPETES